MYFTVYKAFTFCCLRLIFNFVFPILHIHDSAWGHFLSSLTNSFYHYLHFWCTLKFFYLFKTLFLSLFFKYIFSRHKLAGFFPLSLLKTLIHYFLLLMILLVSYLSYCSYMKVGVFFPHWVFCDVFFGFYRFY